MEVIQVEESRPKRSRRSNFSEAVEPDAEPSVADNVAPHAPSGDGPAVPSEEATSGRTSTESPANMPTVSRDRSVRSAYMQVAAGCESVICPTEVFPGLSKIEVGHPSVGVHPVHREHGWSVLDAHQLGFIGISGSVESPHNFCLSGKRPRGLSFWKGW